ncbi:MAG: alkaline phosphatase family protein, partial [OM182 bacterium]|nr:alkaline phosphatase family protein [OM182 bacterium]
KSHGGQSLRERTTWIATNSQRLNSNFESLPGIVDILPSILDHLTIVPPPKIAAQLDGVSFVDRQDNEPVR